MLDVFSLQALSTFPLGLLPEADGDAVSAREGAMLVGAIGEPDAAVTELPPVEQTVTDFGGILGLLSWPFAPTLPEADDEISGQDAAQVMGWYAQPAELTRAQHAFIHMIQGECGEDIRYYPGGTGYGLARRALIEREDFHGNPLGSGRGREKVAIIYVAQDGENGVTTVRRGADIVELQFDQVGPTERGRVTRILDDEGGCWTLEVTR